MTTSQLLALAGEMATAARNLVGGQNITIGRQAPASIYSVAALAEKLRDAVDAYDAAMIEATREGKK
jgi:hypothetical protein